MGPKARAKAPIERNIPKMAPFWFGGPQVETKVVNVGTTAEEGYAYRQSPIQSDVIDEENPITKKESIAIIIP